jgi:hypothetical protein
LLFEKEEIKALKDTDKCSKIGGRETKRRERRG